MKLSIISAGALFAAVAFGQLDSPAYVSRELQFQHAATAQQYQEIATVVRVIAELPQVNVMETAGRLQIRGPRERIPTAEWVFAQLDQPRPEHLPAASETHAMSPQPQNEDQVRVFHLAHAANPRGLQEAATVLRSLAMIRRIMTYNETAALAIRGTADELKFAEWLLEELDRAPGIAKTSGREYITRDRRFEYPVRVFVPPAMPPDRLQALVAELRKTSDRGWIFTYTPLPAIAVRTIPEQMAAVAALFRERGW